MWQMACGTEHVPHHQSLPFTWGHGNLFLGAVAGVLEEHRMKHSAEYLTVPVGKITLLPSCGKNMKNIKPKR